jgi:hypothetical protein
MRARRIIQNGAFEPEEIAFLDDVFAASWKQIEVRTLAKLVTQPESD